MTDTRKDIKFESVVVAGMTVEAVAGVRCPECAGVAYRSPVGEALAELHAFTCSMPDFAPR